MHEREVDVPRNERVVSRVVGDDRGVHLATQGRDENLVHEAALVEARAVRGALPENAVDAGGELPRSGSE